MTSLHNNSVNKIKTDFAIATDRLTPCSYDACRSEGLPQHGLHVQLFAVVTPSVRAIYLINFSNFGLYSKYDKVGYHDLPLGLRKSNKSVNCGRKSKRKPKITLVLALSLV